MRVSELESLKREVDGVLDASDARLRAEQEQNDARLRAEQEQNDARLRAEQEQKEALTSELRAQREWSAKLNSRATSLLHRLAELDGALEARATELAAIRQSTSWQVTGPLRWLATKHRQMRSLTILPHLRRQRPGPSTNLSPAGPTLPEALRFASSAADRVRVIAVTHNLDHEGAPNSQFEVVVGLHRLGVIEPIVVSPTGGPLALAYHEAGIPLQIIPAPSVNTLASFDESAKEIARIFSQSGAEVVYANTLQTFWAVDVARRAGMPAIWNVHESEAPDSYFDFLAPDTRALAYQCLQHSHRVVFVADATRRIWEPLKSRDNFTTIHSTLDLDRLRERSARWHRVTARAELGISENEITLLLVGTVCERKGQLDLLRSLRLLPAELMSRLRVFFVGDRDGPYSMQLRAEANSLPANISSRVVIVAETHDPYLYFHASDVAVCCSRIESYPRVVLEAMAFDLPLVTTPVFGIAEQVQNEVNGLFYSPGDIARLASHLARLISNNALRAEMASASSRVLASLPNHSVTLDRYAHLFREAGDRSREGNGR